MRLTSNKNILSLSITLVMMGVLSSFASAHHSRSNFDLDTDLEFSGTVTEYSWRNPHTFATVAVEDEMGATKELLFELNSVSVLTRSGWTRDTIQVGDRVTVVASPDFDANKNLFYSKTWMLSDGSSLATSGGGGPRGAPAQADNSGFSEDFTGIWEVSINRLRNASSAQMSLGGQGAAFGLPFTELAEAEIAAFDVTENPWFSCVSRTPPWITSTLGGHKFTRDGDTINIRYEINDVDRTIHLGMTEHPSDTQPSHLGHSIGWFEGETLVVDTAYFAPAKWGNGGGLSSSDQKHLVERFNLADGGRALEYEYDLTDPVYLTETLTMSSVPLSYNPNYAFQDEYGCDPEASRRHLTD